MLTFVIRTRGRLNLPKMRPFTCKWTVHRFFLKNCFICFLQTMRRKSISSSHSKSNMQTWSMARPTSKMWYKNCYFNDNFIYLYFIRKTSWRKRCADKGVQVRGHSQCYTQFGRKSNRREVRPSDQLLSLYPGQI